MKKADLHKLVHECIQEVLSEKYNEFQRVDKGAKKVASKDKAEEDVYGAGFAAGEKAAKEKYKKLAEAYKALKGVKEGIHDRDITSAPHTNVKTPPQGVGDYDPKKRAASLARLKNMGPKPSLNKESRFEAKSKLEKVIQQAWAEKDLNKAKQIVIDLIEPSRIKSKDTIISTLKSITNKPKLDQYLANSLLKFEKMGLNEVDSSLKFTNVKEGEDYIASTDFSIFKKGDKVHVYDVDKQGGMEVVLTVKNDEGKTDTIKGDLEDEVEVFN